MKRRRKAYSSQIDKSMERPEGQAKTIPSQKSSAFAKPTHKERREVRSKMDRTIRGVREDKAGHLQAI
jgi:hypothetical protein